MKVKITSLVQLTFLDVDDANEALSMFRAATDSVKEINSCDTVEKEIYTIEIL